MKRQEPGPPLLFTMIMNAMVMPRTTSRLRRRFGVVGPLISLMTAAGAMAGFDICAIGSLHLRCTLPYASRVPLGHGSVKSQLAPDGACHIGQADKLRAALRPRGQNRHHAGKDQHRPQHCPHA